MRTKKNKELHERKLIAYSQINISHCQGCGRKDRLTRSHTLSVKKHPEFIDNLDNIFVLCIKCHRYCEESKFHYLNCGETMVRKMYKLHPESAMVRIFKMIEILNEEGIAPEWVHRLCRELGVSEHLTAIENKLPF